MNDLIKVEGKDAGEKVTGVPMEAPQTGKPFRFAHAYEKGAPQKIRITSPVSAITVKKERIIIRTENSVCSLEHTK